jgi:transcriptional regulator with XRE-family HTH domain
MKVSGQAPDPGLHLCGNSPTGGSGRVIGARRERQEAGGFAARLRQVLRAHGSASALAKAVGRSEGALRKWLRGQSEPNVTDLRALGAVTQTRIEWLVSGQGPREAPGAADPEPADRTGASRDGSTAPRQQGSGALDLLLLEAVMTAVDEQLRLADLDLSAAKRSALLAAAYDLARDREGVEREAVARLVRLAR